MILQSTITFLVCAAPGFLAGYAVAAIIHNRRITRENRRVNLPFSIERL